MEVAWRYRSGIINSIDEIPKDAIGFVYKILNKSNGKWYIGKKSLYSITNPQISKTKYDRLKKEGVPVTKTKNKSKSKKGSVVWNYKQKNIKKETDWLSYTGSNKELNQDIKNGDLYEKRILKFCFSKKDLTYHEVKEQMILEVLENCDSYNSNILSKFFKMIDCE